MAQIQLQKMKTQLLHHYEQAEQRFIKNISLIPETLEAVKHELTAQKVAHNLKLSDLQNGEFVTIFEDYHKKKMQQRIPEADFEQWLILCNIDTDKLTELETRYRKLLDIKHYFYIHNHDYWFTKETYKDYERVSHPEAPKKKEYTINDFLKISKDSYKLNIDSELFKLYLTNEAQLKAMGIVTDQVKLCKRRNDKPAATIKIAGELVKDIDSNYNITWNTEKILNIK
mgnify:CR=1 FL=1